MKNPFAKTRDVEKPYAVFVSHLLPDWEWRVLKTYQNVENEKKNGYARWFCAVESPDTYGAWEYGDTYVDEIINEADGYLLSCEPEWTEAYLGLN